MSSSASSESKVLLCPACGYVGTRTFKLDSSGVWRDVLGGAYGVTPEDTTCSNCGNHEYKLIGRKKVDLRIINLTNGVFTVEDEDGVRQEVELYVRQVHKTIPGVSLICSPIEVEVGGDEEK